LHQEQTVLRHLRFVLALVPVLALALALAACTGEQSIKGQVTSVDATARTFVVQATDGKTYEFKVPSGSAKVDLTHIKEHLDQKKEIEVKYRGDTPPYEATYAH
jgi:ABC-type Fe3+-hydroxamate transport system substrate-binding protein